MDKAIIYPQNQGVAVVHPAPQYFDYLMAQGNEELDAFHLIAQKDVPTGVPYRIVPISEIPTDRADRNAWDADFTKSDGVGS